MRGEPSKGGELPALFGGREPIRYCDQWRIWPHPIRNQGHVIKIFWKSNSQTGVERKAVSRSGWSDRSSEMVLARMIHEHFCCNRRSVATTSLRPAGSPFAPSPYCTSTHQVLRAPRAGLATRLSDFVTNCHASCGLEGLRLHRTL